MLSIRPVGTLAEAGIQPLLPLAHPRVVELEGLISRMSVGTRDGDVDDDIKEALAGLQLAPGANPSAGTMEAVDKWLSVEENEEVSEAIVADMIEDLSNEDLVEIDSDDDVDEIEQGEAGQSSAEAPPLPPPYAQSEASVILVGGDHASEHDSFNGACNARIVTPPPAADVPLSNNSVHSWGGARGAAATATAAAAASDGGRLLATTVIGEAGKALLAQFYPKSCLIAVSDVSRGLHRGFISLRIAPARGSSGSSSSSSSSSRASGGVICLAGSQTAGSSLVFLGRLGVSALQAVRVDPWDALGSLSQPLGDGGPVIALACHPSRPIVAACLSDGSISLWDYHGADGQGSGSRHSGGGAGGVGGVGGGGGGAGWGAAAGGEAAGGGDGFAGMGGGASGVGIGSPSLSPPKMVRGTSKAGKDEKIPLKPRLEGRLSWVATLTTQGMPWGSPLPEVMAEGFETVAFHPAREWLCACTGRGLVGVWNLDGVVGGNMNASRGGGAGGEDSGLVGPTQGAKDGPNLDVVRPFAARVVPIVVKAEPDATVAANGSNVKSNGNGTGDFPDARNASQALALGGAATTTSPPFARTAEVTCVFLAAEPVVMVALSVGLRGSASGLRIAGDPPASSRLVLLSLLDATLPVLYSVVAPHAIGSLCVEPRSGRIFASRSAATTTTAAAASLGPAGMGADVGGATAIASAAAGRSGPGASTSAGKAFGPFSGSNEGGVAGAAKAAWNGPSSLRSGEGWMATAGKQGDGREGAVSVLALTSGSFLDRGPYRLLNTTMEVPPTVFLDGVIGGGGGAALAMGGGRTPPQQPLIPLPLQVYFLRSMVVLIQAGPGGGVDVPAVKAVLHAQGLERDKGLKDRSKPRRLASLPGHTDDLLRHSTGEELSSSGFSSGHLMPYRLVAGPLLRLSGSDASQEERRRFLVLYEIVASEGSDRPHAPNRDAALRETSRTVCGLVTPAGYGEAHGRYENEAQLSHLFPATDGCFVHTSAQSGEPSALLVEGGGYLTAVYSIPDMKLLGRKALSLPVMRVLATPDCLGSQRGKVLYVVRSPRYPLGFLETMVYSDRGGLQCPEPLLPVVSQGDGGGAIPGWGGGRPYANAHLVLEPDERVVDVKFQQLTTVAELATWGYRRDPASAAGAATNAQPPVLPMLALLTTRRVLILAAPRLTPIAEAWGHPRSSRSALGTTGGLSVSPVAMAWAGSSVVCTLEDGRIVYLKPGDGMSKTGTSYWDQEPDTPGGDLLVSSSPWRPLCAVDRHLCAGGVGIAACLPDRLCLVVRGGAGGGISHLVTRPFFPLEPLVSGVVAAASGGASPPPPPSLLHCFSPGSGRRRGNSVERLLDNGTLHVLRRIVARYAPPRSRLPRGTGPGDGPGLGAGATCTAFRLLTRYGLHVLAAEVAGVSSGAGGGDGMLTDTRSSDVFMRRRPWISPLERSRCAALLLLPSTAMIEGIGDDPALVDIWADPDTMTSALLPAVRSRLARMALSLAHQSDRLGLHDDAARLLDLSGDDARLSDYLKRHVDGGSNKDGPNKSGSSAESENLIDPWEEEEADADRVATAAAERLRALVSAQQAATSGRPVSATTGNHAAAGLFRRSSLLAGVSRLPQPAPGGLKAGALEAAGGGATWDAIMREAKPPAGGLSFGGGGGGGGGSGEGPPSSTLRPLALHCAEQWLGRVRPECLEVNSNPFATVGRPQSLLPTPSAPNATPKAVGDPDAIIGAGLMHRFASAAAGGGIGVGAGSAAGEDGLAGGRSQQEGGGVAASGAAATATDTTSSASGENSSLSAASSTSSLSSAATRGGFSGGAFGGGEPGELLQQPWVSVGGSWRDEENVCGYWRFSEGTAVVDGLEDGKQLEIRDLSKYASVAVARGQGLTFKATSSPVDPGEKGKVAEAVDVCFPDKADKDSEILGGASDGGGDLGGGSISVAGGYRRGVFVRAARGSSIDVGLFHDDQRRSVATVEIWVHASSEGNKRPDGDEDAEEPVAATMEGGIGEREISAPSLSPAGPPASRGSQQEFHVLACRVSSSGEHVWSLVVENNGQLAFIPGPRGRRELGPGFHHTGGSEDEGSIGSAKIGALKEAVYTEAGAFAWDMWTHVAVNMDTSRDESSAEVRLFLDGLRVGSGTCRFNKVQRYSLSDTWMVLGPDLVGWKLTEARLWAMLRDEEALQDWKDNSLSLAETKKARLIIRAASSFRDSAPTTRGAAGRIRFGRLAPPPDPGVGPSTGRGFIPPPRGPTTKDPRKIQTASGLGALSSARLRPPAAPAPSRDPRKIALSAKQSRSTTSVGTTTPTKAQLSGAGAVAAAVPAIVDFAEFPAEQGRFTERRTEVAVPRGKIIEVGASAARGALPEVISSASGVGKRTAAETTAPPSSGFASFPAPVSMGGAGKTDALKSLSNDGVPAATPLVKAVENTTGSEASATSFGGFASFPELEAAVGAPEAGTLRPLSDGGLPAKPSSSTTSIPLNGEATEASLLEFASFPEPEPAAEAAETGTLRPLSDGGLPAKPSSSIASNPPNGEATEASSLGFALFPELETAVGAAETGMLRPLNDVGLPATPPVTIVSKPPNGEATEASSLGFASFPEIGAVGLAGETEALKPVSDGGAPAATPPVTIVSNPAGEGTQASPSSGFTSFLEAGTAPGADVGVERKPAIEREAPAALDVKVEELPTTTAVDNLNERDAGAASGVSEIGAAAVAFVKDPPQIVPDDEAAAATPSAPVVAKAADGNAAATLSSGFESISELRTAVGAGKEVALKSLGDDETPVALGIQPEATSPALICEKPTEAAKAAAPPSGFGPFLAPGVEGVAGGEDAQRPEPESPSPPARGPLAAETFATPALPPTAANASAVFSSYTDAWARTLQKEMEPGHELHGKLSGYNFAGPSLPSPTNSEVSSQAPTPSVSRWAFGVGNEDVLMNSQSHGGSDNNDGNPGLRTPRGAGSVETSTGAAETSAAVVDHQELSGASDKVMYPGTMTISSFVLAGPEGTLTPGEAAEAHARSPLLGSSAAIMSVVSSQAEIATVAVVDLWKGGTTIRYPIGCLSAILSPRSDEQVIALLKERAIQVFSVTHRVRRRQEVLEASDVRLWKWLTDHVIAIVTKTAVLRWDVRGTFVPKELFARHQPDSSAPSDGINRVCDFQSTADGRWGLLFVADEERLCDGCRDDPDGPGACACEISLMLDLHDSGGSGGQRHFRALGAALLDTSKQPSAGIGWDEPLLAAVVPDHDTGLHLLQLLRPGDIRDNSGDDCRCSIALQEGSRQSPGCRRLRMRLRESKLPAVPYRILTWRPAEGVNFLAVVTLGGGMTVFEMMPQAVALRKVFHDEKAFPAGVVGVEEDFLHGDLVVVSAGVGQDLTWVISRAFPPVRL